MHEYNILDLNWYLRVVITGFVVVCGLIYSVKTAAKYFLVDGYYDSNSQSLSESDRGVSRSCAVCGSLSSNRCARCKAVLYCSEACQRSHWKSGHKEKCEEFWLSRNSSLQGRRNTTGVAVSGARNTTHIKKLFKWKNQGYPPCGLLNCGNSIIMEYQNPSRTQCLNSDIISTLPQNIIEDILTRMPIRDALRTSVLSKKWRYTWRGMPQLVFTDDMVTLSCNSVSRQLEKYKLVSAIFHVLLLHNGPEILEFVCSVGHLCMDSEFVQIISYLARGNKVKGLLFKSDYRSYKLPVSFFSLQRLECIHLEYCTLEPPLTFNGFSQLTTISLDNVEVSAIMLQRFLAKCPLLENLALNGYQNFIDFVAEGNKFTFVDLLRRVPLIKTLDISKYYMKYLSARGMPHKLPTSLVHLENLFLEVCMTEQNQISSALCMIRSSQLLVKIKFLMYDDEKLPVGKTTNFLDPDDYSNLNLDHLEIFEIKKISSNLPLVMDLVKLIMAKSPVLKTVQMELKDNVSVDEEVKMLRDLVLVQVPRASPSAKLIIVRPKTS